MADSKITALDNLTSADPANDMIPIVDVSATPPASGNTKRISINNLLACSPSATLASATISGALTVDTTTLVVNPSGYADRVGILTASPTHLLDVRGIIKSNGTFTAYINPSFSGAAAIQTESAESLILAPSGQESLRCAPSGVYTFGDGAGGTRMTLNSTGLGVGGSASARIHAIDTGGACALFTRAAAPAAALSAIYIQAPVSSGFSSSPVMNFWYQNTGISNPASECFAIRTSSADRLYIDAVGNVGIGVTPSAWTSSDRALQFAYGNSIATATSTNFSIARNAQELAGGWTYSANGFVQLYNLESDGAYKWYTAASGTAGNLVSFGSAKMTLDTSGNLLVGKTTTAATALGGVAYIGRVDCSRDTGNAATFNHTTAGNLVGNIAITSTATTYNSASDYRLKEAVQPLSGGLARVSALKPSIYKWKVDGSNGEGFLAHELADVVPLAVTGEKDAVNEDGSIKAQSIDMSRVVPILVAAIQELTAEVNALKNA